MSLMFVARSFLDHSRNSFLASSMLASSAARPFSSGAMTMYTTRSCRAAMRTMQLAK